MKPLTAGALVALYALCHRIGLCEDERGIVESDGASLTPALWAETLSLLETADAAGNGAVIDLGFSSLVLSWLGCADEAACVECHGMTIAEALVADIGSLASVARIVEGDRDPETAPGRACHALVARIWAERAARVSRAAPEGAVAALEQVLLACVEQGDLARMAMDTIVCVAEAGGDPERAGRARRVFRRLGGEQVAESPVPTGAALVLTVLWCLTHDEGLLACEREGDAEVEHTPEAWARVWAASRQMVERAFGRPLVILLRASEIAQQVVTAALGQIERGDEVALLAIAVLDAEKVAWVRWVSGHRQLRALVDDEDDLPFGIRARLMRVFSISDREDEEIRSASWPTRWHVAGGE